MGDVAENASIYRQENVGTMHLFINGTFLEENASFY
jgi:hypothetical protein